MHIIGHLHLAAPRLTEKELLKRLRRVKLSPLFTEGPLKTNMKRGPFQPKPNKPPPKPAPLKR